MFENAKSKLNEAKVLIDRSGNLEFRTQLAKHLNQKINTTNNKTLIKQVKMQKSSSNNLLQLADYVAGVINRNIQGEKKNADSYHKISHREIYVQIWSRL